MRYLQYGQIKTTNRQFQTFRDLKSERSDKSRIGHESMSFVTISCLRSRTLYKEKLLQYLDIVGVVFLCLVLSSFLVIRLGFSLYGCMYLKHKCFLNY